MDILREESVEKLMGGYTSTQPFPFIVIDDFLKDGVLDDIKLSVNNLKTESANHYLPQYWEHNKYGFTKDFDECLQNIFARLNSDEFISYIEQLTGIKDIIRNDVTLAGAGVHRTTNGGFLDIHTDFNTYVSKYHDKIDRRINLLIYLNPDWKDEYGGQLLLCDPTSVKYKVLPQMNRAVIFNTTKSSFHGHPIPLTVPDGVTRQSIAVYYYTKHQSPNDFEGEPMRRVMIYDSKQYDYTNSITI
jgi:Rps23 Pro-64 3,4-dihydroxylase Tpa1-like proline 4-hydroxylase